jgi:hypothetical protein
MEHRAAKINAGNDNHALLLPLPLPSSAHLVAMVLVIRTIFDTLLPSPLSSSSIASYPHFLLLSAGPLQALVVSRC